MGEVLRALQVVGDRWSFLLMRDAFLGVRRFDSGRRLTGASRGCSPARLNAMVDAGLFHRSPVRQRTEPTPNTGSLKRVSAFYPVALCMWTWENRWAGLPLPAPADPHDRGKSLHPRLACAHCESSLNWREIALQTGSGCATASWFFAVSHPPSRKCRLVSHLDGVDTMMFHSVDTVGDRWTALLVGVFFLGLRALRRHQFGARHRDQVSLPTGCVAGWPPV